MDAPPPERPARDRRGYDLRAPRTDRGVPQPADTRRGVGAALRLFAVAVAVELATLTLLRFSHDPVLKERGVYPMGVLVGMGGLAAAMVVSRALPRASRAAFWTTGITCIFASAILWAVTCAVVAPPRVGG